ncbi:hypothetical protein FSP39_011026 [Pinctada imbricata]|uniref:Carbohydrate sulfotransferase n=1 Tax=Pinctada imbricata TaxID=66713 RepID=A0AA89C3K0_PINIB|nr:hypothetical protein FSP39_011026 [Pinctada imbricata]
MNNLVIDGKILFSREESSAEETELFRYIMKVIYIRKQSYILLIGVGFVLAVLFLLNIRNGERVANSRKNNAEIINRRVPLHNLCNTALDLREKVDRYEISGSGKYNFSYCMVYKAATTTWLRIIRFLNGEDLSLKSPFDSSKYRTHYYNASKFIPYFKYNQNQDFLDNSLRVMTVRDPYTRLWSAYIDKFLLPDFWHTRGRCIVNLLRKRKADQTSLRCGHNVTFKEFVEYVVSPNEESKRWHQDKHWIPATEMCRLDQFKPHIILKQENLRKDIFKIFKKLNLPASIDKTSSEDLTDYEMMDQLDYVFKVSNFDCVSPATLGERIWKAFQYNSYIPLEIMYPKDEFHNNLTMENMRSVLRSRRESWLVKSEVKKLQKREAMISAYKTVPLKTLYELRNYYKDDFKAFGYESKPSDIFEPFIGS